MLHRLLWPGLRRRPDDRRHPARQRQQPGGHLQHRRGHPEQGAAAGDGRPGGRRAGRALRHRLQPGQRLQPRRRRRQHRQAAGLRPADRWRDGRRGEGALRPGRLQQQRRHRQQQRGRHRQHRPAAGQGHAVRRAGRPVQPEPRHRLQPLRRHRQQGPAAGHRHPEVRLPRFASLPPRTSRPADLCRPSFCVAQETGGPPSKHPRRSRQQDREDTMDEDALDEDMMWRAVMRRDGDGRFVYAVRTTGVYCRPSCPSRRAKRENVAFHPDAAAAEAAGFRPCKRCRPDAPPSALT
ncbi:hypothetical protein TSH58p_19765 (plasmid) [Azospirillum sp. TSH58]|nr:hypothetical protein TSH58p_19765 [Azospirillum sp. TSH58]